MHSGRITNIHQDVGFSLDILYAEMPV